MTAKEKAKSLYGVFLKCSIEETPTNIHFDYKHLAKQCALIAVDEIIAQFVGVYNSLKNANIIYSKVEDSNNYKYWQEVKQEIEAL